MRVNTTTPLHTTEELIKETTAKILDLSLELCKQINTRSKQKKRIKIKKLRRQIQQHRKLARKITRHLQFLSKLRKEFKVIRNKYRHTPAPPAVTQNVVVKVEPLETQETGNINRIDKYYCN